MQNNHYLLIGLAGLLTLAGCAKAPDTAAEAVAEASDARAEADVAIAEAAAKTREADFAQREAQIATREAELATAAARTANARPTVTRPPAPRPTSTANDRPASNPPAPAPVIPLVLTVPSGTQLSLALATALSSKNAKVGDAVRARVTQDVRVNDRVAIPSGSTVSGQVINVVSGSDKIGGVPGLGLRFERLELPGGVDVPIDGELREKGKSDTGRDTAKIVGGAAAGAILGGQVKGGDKGKVLGGLLGGAIGAVAAQKTGTEVTLPEGAEFAIALTSPVEITRR